MIVRFVAFVVLLYAIGFLVFSTTLPRPAGDERTDAVIVPTGGSGRIDRGLEVLREGFADQLFVSGVDPEVTEEEFETQFSVRPQEMRCCVTLGYLAVDTRSNAGETAQWLADNEVESVRLVTTDWHMRRVASEMRDALPEGTVMVEDAVRSTPDLGQLFLEYNKLLASLVSQGIPA